MSSNVDGQGENRLSTLGDTVKKKAKSFCNVRSKAGTLMRIPSTVQGSGTEVRKPRMRVRTGSFSDTCSTEEVPKKAAPKKTFSELLEEKMTRFLRGLQYVQDVVDKCVIRDQLPGSVTIVIENIIDINQLLSSAINQKSSLLESSWGQVFESLCCLIQWSDQILLSNDDTAVDLRSSSSIISGVRDAVTELVSRAKEKMNTKNATSPSQNTLQPMPFVSAKTSLPEIPLTPRERQLLKEFQEASKPPGRTRSAEDLLDDKWDQPDDPPPKPPLPADFSTLLLRTSATNSDLPPPIPSKHRVSVPCDSSVPMTSLLRQHRTLAGCHSPACSIGSSSVSSSVRSNSVFDDPMQRDFDQMTSFHMQPFRQISRMSDYDNVEDNIDGFSSSCEEVQVTPTPNSDVPALPPKTKKSSIVEFDDSTRCVASVKLCTTSSRTQVFTQQSSSLIQSTSFESFMHSGSQARSFQVSQQITVTQDGKLMVPDQLVDADNQTGAPPLPPKLKHTVQYMKVFGHYNVDEFMNDMRSHGHPYSMVEPSFEGLPQFLGNIPWIRPVSYSSSENSLQKADDAPPLPPKKSETGQRDRDSSISLMSRYSDESLPVPESCEPASAPVISYSNPVCLPAHPSTCETQKDSDSAFIDTNVLEDIDVSDQLIHKSSPDEDGPEIRGGSVDALIVHTTASTGDFVYQDAFLMTYRTFISPAELIKKLLYRYNHFSKSNDAQKKKLANNTFSLLYRVVKELCTETDDHILQILMDLVCQLVRDGELMLARTMRKVVIEKCATHHMKQKMNQRPKLLPDFQLTAKCHKLTDFKSEHIAQQITLLDAEQFQKIEISEILIWAKKQSEESSPNLTKFTEHFNKMSFWCRSRILEHEDPRERERHFKKFIKIMQCLREMNNFNSYLAILAAVDSAPVRRLEWQKQNVEALKEFCSIIDSSSSFRVYRQALAKAEPPCIPYIGLVLQDMTFVHIGNPDKLADGHINFTKRWQMFNILKNMQRFAKCNYGFKKNEKIIAFCNNFDNFISEESLWQLSLQIKPRASK